MKRKIFIIMMATILVFSLCACQSKEEKKAEALSSVDSYAASCNSAEIQLVIDEYYDIMTDEEKQMVLESLGISMALGEVEAELIPKLKSPSSYVRYESDVSSFATYHEEEDKYNVMVKLKYGATNSFGAEVTDTLTAFYYFKMDLDNGTAYTDDVTLFMF